MTPQKIISLIGRALLVALLSGCGIYDKPDWQIAIETSACTPQQMHKVRSESVWCKDNTTYTGAYCYGTSIMRDCTRKNTTCI